MEEILGRHALDLQAAGYAPVWTSSHGYPGEIPQEIQDLLCEDSKKCDKVIGPLSSIFWLIGTEFLIELIDDPAYILEEEYRYLPLGSPRLWIISRLFEEDKIPKRFMEMIENSPSGLHQPHRNLANNLARNSPIPQSVTPHVQQHSVNNLFPFGRSGNSAERISAAKIKWDKNSKRFATTIQRKLLSTFGDNLLFRGLTRPALLSLMTLFCPVIVSHYADNEFGPGFYTTPNLSVAVRYGGPAGAVLVFENPSDRLNRLVLAGEAWQNVTRFWTGNIVSNHERRAPVNWRMADILEGPISEPGEARHLPRVESEVLQVVGVSPKSFEAFRSSLKMIIWID